MYSLRFEVLIILVVLGIHQQHDIESAGTDPIMATTPNEKGNINIY